MVGDIWDMDEFNSIAARAAKAASVHTGTINDGGSANNDASAATDSGGHREAQRCNRQTRIYRR
jgi:hypothetical protein